MSLTNKYDNLFCIHTDTVQINMQISDWHSIWKIYERIYRCLLIISVNYFLTYFIIYCRINYCETKYRYKLKLTYYVSICSVNSTMLNRRIKRGARTLVQEVGDFALRKITGIGNDSGE